MSEYHRIRGWVIAWMTVCFVVAVFCFCAAVAPSCGSQFDLTELARIRAVTCPSLCAVYDEAKADGMVISPEDEALIGACKCH